MEMKALVPEPSEAHFFQVVSLGIAPIFVSASTGGADNRFRNCQQSYAAYILQSSIS